VARRELTAARRGLNEIEPRLEAAEKTLDRTQQALAARAVALYRAGELGPLRVIFAAESLPDMISRASALRLLVRHDVNLVERFGQERDDLDALRSDARVAVEKRESANAQLGRLARQLVSEREGKTAILDRVRENRTTERRLLLELEQAAQALEETIRTLGSQAARGGASSVLPAIGLAARKGLLPPPVDAEITVGSGRVVDPEFKTSTFRSGVDFAAPAGTPVRAVGLGVVRFAGWFRGYGRIVIVDHGDAFHTVSGHLDEIAVEVDQRVVEGEMLGTVGETGSLLGPSLYFELRREGQPVDPEDWLWAERG
jgi:septal ring factor EnvC (AmiA/AmiB activator)